MQNQKTEGKLPVTEEQLRNILKQAEGIRYGTLTLVFQDGRLIQIDRNEKIRIV